MQWISKFPADNLRPPIELDVGAGPWPEQNFDAIYTANTAHIMAWSDVQSMFANISAHLLPGGLFALYGPMKYQGEFTSESNRLFDLHLREHVAHRGIREFYEINQLAISGQLVLLDDHDMPANNRLLIWQKA